jgi:hypothetical protein
MADADNPRGLDPLLLEAERRGYLTVEGDRITYHCKTDRTYCFSDPEERARAHTYSWLIIERSYLPQQVDLEVTVPRRTPNPWADIVVYEDTACRRPYLIVENVKRAATAADVVQRIERGGVNTPDEQSGTDDFGDSVAKPELELGSGIFVAASPIHGRGVFASVPFAPGDLMECCPVVIVPPEDARPLAGTDLGGKCFEWGSDARALALGYGSLYNHARFPNARYILSLKAQTMRFVAVRPIARNEEITINYSGYPDGSREHRFDAPSRGGTEPEAWDEA